jgi:hypothetical protein
MGAPNVTRLQLAQSLRARSDLWQKYLLAANDNNNDDKSRPAAEAYPELMNPSVREPVSGACVWSARPSQFGSFVFRADFLVVVLALCCGAVWTSTQAPPA